MHHYFRCLCLLRYVIKNVNTGQIASPCTHWKALFRARRDYLTKRLSAAKAG